MHHPSARPEMRLFSELRRTGSPQAREALVRRYLPLARHTARRFQRASDSLEDLTQVASYALLKAIDGFDPSRGLAFSSYAIPTITGELKRHARDTSWGMRVPRGLQERVLDVERTITDLTPRLRRSPTPAEIAGEMGVETEQVIEAIEAGSSYTLESLNASLSVDAEAGTRMDMIGAEDPHYDLVDDTHALGPLLRDLPARERTILALRFGEELPQSEIARRLGISQMHVSRLLRRTLDQLHEQAEAEQLIAA